MNGKGRSSLWLSLIPFKGACGKLPNDLYLIKEDRYGEMGRFETYLNLYCQHSPQVENEVGETLNLSIYGLFSCRTLLFEFLMLFLTRNLSSIVSMI